jgi:hypothetical protein
MDAGLWSATHFWWYVVEEQRTAPEGFVTNILRQAGILLTKQHIAAALRPMRHFMATTVQDVSARLVRERLSKPCNSSSSSSIRRRRRGR